MADPANATPAPSTETTAPPTSGMNYESVTHADFSYEHGTAVGDYHAHEQFQAHTPNHQLETGSDVDAHGHFTNMHDYGITGTSASHFNLDDPGHGSNAAEHQDHHVHFDHNNGTHQSGAFSDHGNHDSGSQGGHHDSGHTDHGGSHADHGSTGVSQ